MLVKAIGIFLLLAQILQTSLPLEWSFIYLHKNEYFKIELIQREIAKDPDSYQATSLGISHY